MKKDWKRKREEEIERHIIMVLLVIALLFGAYALGSTVTYEMCYGRPTMAGRVEYGLYAGITNEDWLSYVPEMVQNDVDTVNEEAINEEDVETLAKIVYAEAGGQGRKCMVYVGSVILNRLTDGKSWQTGDTIMEVWSRKGQYEGTYRRRATIKPSAEAYEVARELLTNGSVLPSYVLYQHHGRCVRGTKKYDDINGEYFSY